MTKANISYEQVAAFCEEQVSLGKKADHITFRMKQEALAPDSGLDTISKLIKRWRVERADGIAAGIVLAEPELAPILRVIKDVVASKCAERERHLSEQIHDLISQLEGTNGDLEAALKENNDLSRLVGYLIAQGEEMKRNIASLRQALELIAKDSVKNPAEANTTTQAASGGGPGRPETVAEAGLPAHLGPQAAQAASALSHGQLTQHVGASSPGQADLSLSGTSSNSNKGPEEKPHVQG